MRRENMDLFLCIVLPFALGLLVRRAYKRLPLLAGSQLARWTRRLEIVAKTYFGFGALFFSAAAVYIHLNELAPQALFSLQFYSLMIGWLLGFAAIQFMRRHYHTGQLRAELQCKDFTKEKNSSNNSKNTKGKGKTK